MCLLLANNTEKDGIEFFCYTTNGHQTFMNFNEAMAMVITCLKYFTVKYHENIENTEIHKWHMRVTTTWTISHLCIYGKIWIHYSHSPPHVYSVTFHCFLEHQHWAGRRARFISFDKSHLLIAISFLPSFLCFYVYRCWALMHVYASHVFRVHGIQKMSDLLGLEL